jgi:hypothetical protein
MRDEQYERLNKLEPTRRQLFEYGWALKELAEGLTSHGVWDMFRHIDQAQRYLTEFRSHFVKTDELTEKEANFSAGLHTYMRKCMDSHLGTMLYSMISEGRGKAIWYAFIKGLIIYKKHFDSAMMRANMAYETDKSTDNLFMLKALAMWGEQENFNDAIEWLKGS